MTLRRRARLTWVILAWTLSWLAGLPCMADTTANRKIAWDSQSLFLDGQRTFIWSGEMHPFRLPSPSLWRDVLEKMKASGYNTVAFYFDWGYFTPKPGVYDFTGVRDMDRLLTIADEVGLYVIVRPGPYVNAEVTRGGFPGWLATQAANGLTLQSFYMTFGGTSWGWLPAPVVYTSYDYGAAIDEARRLRPKAATMKQLGQFIAVATPLTHMEKGPPVKASSPAIKIYHNVSVAEGGLSRPTHVLFAMHDPSNASSNDAFTFPLQLGDGNYSVPQQGSLRIDGQDAKILVAEYDLERQRLIYSTSEVQTHLQLGESDLALVYGRRHEEGETVLRYPSQPQVDVLSGNIASIFDSRRGDLRLNCEHDGLARVKISGGGRPALLLLIGDESTAQEFWRPDTSAGPVLARSAALVRAAEFTGGVLSLRGDTAVQTELELWTQASTRSVRWNGVAVATTRTTSGSLVVRGGLAGAERFTLPDLARADWYVRDESPEANPLFHDSSWVAADRLRTNGPTKPPAGQRILTMDDYGFHHGDAWYRGRYTLDTSADTLTLHYGGGGAGLLQAWIDGTFVGQDEHDTGLSRPTTTGAATFTVPAGSRTSGPHLIAIMVRNNSHNWDLDADDAHKEGRGLISASLGTRTGPSFAVPIQWKIQGNRGGEDIADTVRGVMNNGGLYGERQGWHLPSVSTEGWRRTSVPDGHNRPGTTWYRTQFQLNVPKNHDASLGLSFGDPSALRSEARYRVLLFVNGWNMGQFIAHIGPQRTFIIPNGILDPRGTNTLALAVTGDGAAGNSLERVALVNLATVRGGVPLELVQSPAWNKAVNGER